MEIKELRIRFGGLVMIVQRDREDVRGLYLLMPGHNHPGFVHCPFLHVEPCFTTSGEGELRSIQGQIVQLQWLAKHGTSRSVSGRVAEVSKYSGRPVAERWLTDPRPTGCLAARIDLPLGSGEFEFLATPSDMLVPIGGSYKPATLYGLAAVTIAPVSGLSQLSIAGLDIKPNADGFLQLSFINVRPKDLDGTRYDHKKNEDAKHVQSYYTLLESWCPMEAGLPLKVGRDVTTGHQEKPSGMLCDEAEYHEIDETHHFVDPYNCIIGGGCPPEHLNC